VNSANWNCCCHNPTYLARLAPLWADYAAFFPAFNFAHLARWNAAIFFRAGADMVRLKGTNPVVFASDIACDSLRAFAHRARCACAILRREAFDIIRVG
jgi:hypothetical protein